MKVKSLSESLNKSEIPFLFKKKLAKVKYNPQKKANQCLFYLRMKKQTHFKASQQLVQELGRTHPESYLGPNQAFAVEIFCENS